MYANAYSGVTPTSNKIQNDYSIPQKKSPHASNIVPIFNATDLLPILQFHLFQNVIQMQPYHI